MSSSGSEKRARRYNVSTRTTEDEKNAIRARARAYGLSLGAYIRETALDKPLPRATRFTEAQGRFIALTLSSLAVMMDHIRTLDHAGQQREIAFSLTREVLLLRDRCFEALGRKP